MDHICLNNVLIGVCKDVSMDFNSIQNRLIEVASNNGAIIEGGLITSILEYQIVNGREIVSMLVGILLNKPVVDSKELEFYDNFELNNIYCYKFEGNPKDINNVVNDISTRIIQENESILTGKVYNHIKYWSKSGDEMNANIYIELKNSIVKSQ